MTNGAAEKITVTKKMKGKRPGLGFATTLTYLCDLRQDTFLIEIHLPCLEKKNKIIIVSLLGFCRNDVS